jgi:HEAT repeat protein
VLRYWQNWSETDIPVLRQIMRSNNYSQVRWVLARIGTDAAIEALVEDLAEHSGALGGETPLVEVADRAMPYIMNGLASSRWHGYRWLIGDLYTYVNPPVEQWASYAADPTNATADRIARLRAIASLADWLDAKKASAPEVQSILRLLEDSDELIQTEAVRAFRSLPETRNTIPAAALVNACPLRSDAFTSRGSPGPQAEGEWVDCLYDLAMKGDAARSSGSDIVRKFLNSPNGYDRAEAATTLGYIGYEPAIPRLTALLDDQDWRVTFAAVRALGWLGAKDAVASVERVATGHWLAEVRTVASDVVAALRTPDGRLRKEARLNGYFSAFEPASAENSFDVNASLIDTDNSCTTRRWTWQGAPIRWRHDVSGFLMPSEQSMYRAEIRITQPRSLSFRAIRGSRLHVFWRTCSATGSCRSTEGVTCFCRWGRWCDDGRGYTDVGMVGAGWRSGPWCYSGSPSFPRLIRM